MSGRSGMKLLLLFLALAAAAAGWPFTALARAESAEDLANTVNELRALNGLAPYQADGGLMAYAQEHAEYMASIQNGTHVHRDGTLPNSRGLEENVAGGDEGVVTVAVVVYEIWVDWGHRHILTGYAGGEIGAGVAKGENGQVYYCVDIRPGEEIPAAAQAVTPALIQAGTSTPGTDGSVRHVVQYGETLWSIAIAYGVKVNDIRLLNGIPADSNVIQTGQNLLIRSASTVPPAAVTETPPAGTATAEVTLSPTDTQAPPPEPSPTPEAAGGGPAGRLKGSLPGLLGLAALLLGLAAAVFGLRQSHRREKIRVPGSLRRR